jgi:toxin CcdB
MQQFDVVANPFPQSRSRQPYLIILQSDLLTHDLKTVVVAPLEPAALGTFADRLNPEIVVDGTPYRLITQELVTVRASVLGQAKTSAQSEHGAIITALDLLFTGF